MISPVVLDGSVTMTTGGSVCPAAPVVVFLVVTVMSLHLTSLQMALSFSVSENGPIPGQVCPPYAGAGLLQRRERSVTPPPHSTVQADHVVQSDHAPSTV